MSVHEGDTVKVVKPLTHHSGLMDRTGEVTFVSQDQQTCSVNLEWDAPEGSGWEKQGVLSSFAFEELEVIKAVDEQEQIFKIASLLHTEGNYGAIPWTEIKADAARMYKLGMRFDG